MKRMMTILMTLTLAATAFAGDLSQDELQNSKTMLIQGVQEGNIGLRCDAIYRLAQLKCYHPEIAMADVEKVLQKTVQKDDVHLVRTYAGLTLAYLNDASLRATVIVEYDETSIDFYQKLQQAVYNNTLASIQQ